MLECIKQTFVLVKRSIYLTV